jgi:hypothetical protein
MTAWSGKGWIVGLCNVAGFIPAILLFLFVPMSFDMAAAVLMGVWGVVSGVAVWFAVKQIESKPPRELIDAATGERHIIPSDAGSFSWLPARWWAYINPVFGLVLAGLAATHVWNFLTLV